MSMKDKKEPDTDHLNINNNNTNLMNQYNTHLEQPHSLNNTHKFLLDPNITHLLTDLNTILLINMANLEKKVD